MDRLGPSIFWLHMLIGEAEGPVLVRTWVVVLGGIPKVFSSTGISPLMSFQFITGGSIRTTAVLRVAPGTISLWRTGRTACKAPLLVATPYVVVWLNGGMMPWMIAEISLFVNNLCGEFSLVVSLSVMFLSFPSLVWLSTNESLFGSLLASSSS